jgi:hypothetical protein
MIIYIVRMGSNNRHSIEWAFKNYDDAVEFCHRLDVGKGATSNFSSIREIYYCEDLKEIIENE